MKVLLIDPPGANKGLNTGLAYLAGALIAGGRDEVLVLDLNNRDYGKLGDPNPDPQFSLILESLAEAIQQFKPDAVGLSVKTFTSGITQRLIAAVRERAPSTPIIVGGAHITLDGSNYLAETGADIGVLGEGDFILPELCRALEEKRPLSDIDGIVYRDGNQVVSAGQRRPPIRDLDALPFPNYRVFSSVQQNPLLLREYPILTTRGCPFNCSYCSMPLLMGRRWRPRSTDNVIAELREAVEKIGATSFTIVDDNFTLDVKRAESICAAIIANGLQMPWSSQNGLRADRLTPELIFKMRQSGCYYVWVGIEAGDEAVFELIEKGERLSDVKAGVRALQAVGIKVGGFFIIGLPGSTREADLKSLALAQELGIEAWWFNFVPYRFTRAEEWVRQFATTLRASEGAPLYGRARIEPVFETPEYPRKERIATYEEVHVRMGYFDRLLDPSAGRFAQIAYLVGIVPKYGFRPTLSLARYLGSNILHWIRGASPARSEESESATAIAPNAASQYFAPSPQLPVEEK